MDRHYILIRLFVLMAGWTMSFAQQDTLVLNQTEFRFPETHPGQVFLVKKVVIAPKVGLGKKSDATAVSSDADRSSLAPKGSSPLASRDLRGRRFPARAGEYQSRLANIHQRHGLPTLRATAQEEGRPFKAPGKYQMPEGGRFALVSNSPLIRSGADLSRMEAAERRAVRNRYGALSPEFSRKLDRMRAEDSVEVVISLETEHPGYVRGDASLEARQENARRWTQRRARASKAEVMRRNGLVESGSEKGASEDARSLRTRVTKSKAFALAKSQGVASIEEWVEPVTLTVPRSAPGNPSELVSSGQNPAGWMISYGGAALAQMETGGLRNDFVNCINSDHVPVTYRQSSLHEEAKAHSEAVYLIAATASINNDLYHFPIYDFDKAADSLIKYGIRTLSTSNAWYGLVETDPSMRAVDRMAYVWPYPTYSLPTANQGHEYVPTHLAYNSLNVGNVQHYDNSTFTVDRWVASGGGLVIQNDFTQSTNPPAKYGSYAPDWELPNLVAPGASPDPWWAMHDPCVLDAGGYMGMWTASHGTSLSAPVVNGFSANLYSIYNDRDPNSAYNPLRVRAALLVTAENVDGGDGGIWDDQRDGMGTVSGVNAGYFAWASPFRDTNDYAYYSGIGAGTLDSADFANGVTPTYNYQMPGEFPEGQHLRIVLTWTSSPGENVSENEISDLGLESTTNYWWIVNSDRLNSNVEVLDLYPDNDVFTPEGEYQIRLQPWTFRKASDGPDFLNYVVAWSWVKDHAD